MLLMNQLACIFRVAAMVSNDDSIEQAADILDCISDMTYCSVCACMQTQQEAQIDFRNKHDAAATGVPSSSGTKNGGVRNASRDVWCSTTSTAAGTTRSTTTIPKSLNFVRFDTTITHIILNKNLRYFTFSLLRVYFPSHDYTVHQLFRYLYTKQT